MSNVWFDEDQREQVNVSLVIERDIFLTEIWILYVGRTPVI